MELLTLNKDDAQLMDYLTGQFSQDQIAIPMRPMHPKPLNFITFKILKKDEVTKPNFLKVLIMSMRLQLLGMTLFPFFLALGYYGESINSVNAPYLGFSFLVLILLHGLAFLLNDYFDHLKGADFMSVTSGSQVIQRGWLTANSVLKLAVVTLLLSLSFSLPIFISYFYKVLPIVVFVLASVVGFSFVGKGFKQQGVGEFFIFSCFGPLMFYGVSLLVEQPLDYKALTVSVTVAWSTVLFQQTRNFQNIYYDSKLGVGSFISRLGFDLAKKVLRLQLAVVLSLMLVSVMVIGGQLMGLILTLTAGALGFLYLKKINKIFSPLSGQLRNLQKLTLTLHHGYCAIIITALLYGNFNP